MVRITAAVAVTVSVTVLAQPALADPMAFDAFGHRFEIRGVGYNEEVWIDGAKVHENAFVFVDAIGVVGGTPVIVGTTATGGNMCGDAPFVVAFPAGGAPVFDGPLDTCSSLVATIEANEVLFRGTPSLLGPGEQWSWQPGAGFVAQAPIAFVPHSESGWTALLRREITHPIEVLEFADTLAQANELMGAARDDVLVALSGPGAGEFHGELYAGDACFPHNCPYSQALLLADGPAQRLFMAWRIDGVETVAPSAELWPKAAQQELDAWRARLTN